MCKLIDTNGLELWRMATSNLLCTDNLGGKMGCRLACSCGGNCMTCGSYQKESYFGEAEDIRARELGYSSFEDHMKEQHYQKQMEDLQRQQYEQDMREYYENEIKNKEGA